jgi:hypothetical protein
VIEAARRGWRGAAKVLLQARDRLEYVKAAARKHVHAMANVWVVVSGVLV